MSTFRWYAHRIVLGCGLSLIWGLPLPALLAQESDAPPAMQTDSESENADALPAATNEGSAIEAGVTETATSDDQTPETETDAAESEAVESSSTATSGVAGPAAAEFQAKFTAWKSLLKNLRDIRAEYLVAPDDALEGLQAKFQQGIEQGKQAARELREAAMAAYREAPDADREITRLLITSAADMIREDRYTDAQSVLQVLVDGGSQEKELSDLVGIAAFGTNDFTTAKEYLQQAESQNSISAKGQQYLGTVDQLIDAWSDEEKIRAAEAAADDLPRVRLQTTAGDIVLELFENEAPETVGNFVSLVEKGFYDQLIFHRVLEAFMAQAGCPEGTGRGGPGYEIYCECVNDNHRNHFAGSLSMAKQPAVNTGGSQFFVTFMPTPFLDGKHTVFGRVVEGIDVLPEIVRVDPENPTDVEPTKILKAEVIRKRDHEYRPHKVR